MYEKVFDFYRICLIYKPKNLSYKYFNLKMYNFGFSLLNILLAVLYIFSTMSFLINIGTSEEGVPFIILSATELVYRWTLKIRMDFLLEISLKMEQLNSKVQKSHKTKILYVFVAMYVLFQLILFILQMVKVPTFHIQIVKNTLKMFAQDEYYAQIIGIAFSLIKYIFFALPVYTFTLFYVTTCYQIRNAILNFLKTITINMDCNYDVLSLYYNSIRSAVDFLDNHTSLLVFCSTTYCFSNMYYFITRILIRNDSHSLIQILYLSFVFLSTLLSFVAMTVSASMVTEASSKVGSAARMVLQSRQTSTFAFKKFLFNAEREINLTVWNIVPIKRSFILGSIGAFFTLVMIFDGIYPKSRVPLPAC